MLNSTKTWQERLETISYDVDDEDLKLEPVIAFSDAKQFISDLIAQTREETIREVGNSIKSFFYSLDDTNDEPFNKGIIQIDLDLVDKQIKDILNKLKK